MKKLSYIIALTLSVGSFASTELDDLIEGVDESSTDFSAFMEEYYGETVEVPEEAGAAEVEAAPLEKPSPVKHAPQERVKPVAAPVFEAKPNAEVFNTSSDALLVTNIPETSRLFFQDEVKILPYNSIVYYKSGKREYSNPLKDAEGNFKNELTTFCSFNLKKFGIGRRMDAGKEFEITGIEHANDQINFENFGMVNVQKVTVKLDNEHLKSLTCLSTEKSNPFTIGDVLYETGGVIDFKLRDFISI
ncbi:hypothetical protein [Vibrio crassostreae]|uniref:hypothetical protein n=1 Tax=Vibrio crassostreae TaxID=246167 RepID=UPI001B30B07F|nr:hypothetical protein [Vibrio crassostreae]